MLRGAALVAFVRVHETISHIPAGDPFAEFASCLARANYSHTPNPRRHRTKPISWGLIDNRSYSESSGRRASHRRFSPIRHNRVGARCQRGGDELFDKLRSHTLRPRLDYERSTGGTPDSVIRKIRSLLNFIAVAALSLSAEPCEVKAATNSDRRAGAYPPGRRCDWRARPRRSRQGRFRRCVLPPLRLHAIADRCATPLYNYQGYPARRISTAMTKTTKPV